MAAKGGLEGDGRWYFWVDCGGTFVDLLAQTPTGEIRAEKVLADASGPSNGKNPIIAGIHKVIADFNEGARAGSSAEASRGTSIASIRIGTTVVTNALLERKVSRPLLLVTRGFRDVLAIGDQTRPDLFALAPQRPAHLYGEVWEIDERVDSAGKVLQALDREAVSQKMQAFRAQGWDAVAVALLHSWIAPEHERIVGELAREAGFSTVVLSSETAPLPGFVKRASGAVADAALTPVLRGYLGELAQLRGLDGTAEGMASAAETKIWCMQSFGGVVAADRARGGSTVLSGPAGGVVGMALGGLAAGYKQLIGFDMGGTSTDVSCFDGDFDEIAGDEIDGVYINSPMLRVHTVAAGGGSVLGHCSGRLQVGPASAGSRPGPACYGRGGPLTITDCHFLLGRLRPRLFRPIFGPAGEELPTLEPVRRLFAEIAADFASADGENLTPLQLAEGFIDVAVAGVSRALKRVTTARGRDPRDYALVVFGSAAGQIACRVADGLGIERLLSHPCASILSAWGIAGSDIKVKRQMLIEQPLQDCPWDSLTEALARLEREVRDEIRLQEGGGAEIEVRSLVHMRPGRAEISYALDFAERDELKRQWQRLCRQSLGLRTLGAAHAPRIFSIEVEGRMAGHQAPAPPFRTEEGAGGEPEFYEEVWIGSRWQQVPFYRRQRLLAFDDGDEEGALIRGPAMIFDEFSTFVVEPGWSTWLDRQGHLHGHRSAEAVVANAPVRCDPVRLEIYNQLFMSVAEQMGELLRETAVSVNIRERRDYSCAIFAPDASLVANAHHVPVHLGAMGDSVAAVSRAAAADLRDGDLWMLNSPYEGGTHLPDVTVIKPVFSGGRLFAWVGARAHHTEIGGIEPGSMPAASRRIEEEGVLIPPCRIGRDEIEDLAEAGRIFSTGPYPSRNVDGNLADLEAQVAACRRGEQELQALIRRGGAELVAAYMGFMRANASAAVAELLRDLSRRGNLFQANDELDDGTRLAVEIRIQGEFDEAGGTAVFDFSGSSGPHSGNFNAPRSVVVAAVLYVLRCLIRHPMPLNSGCLDRVEIIVPQPSILAAEAPVAVAAGNVETSQLVVDILLRALQVSASSQGTMNNMSWGDSQSQYYETICGGSGAVPEHPGLSAVHTHMTNSRLTDAELLELRYPVLLESFSIRAHSGGDGRWPGGDGVCRRLLFFEPVSLSILSSRRSRQPRGMFGGGDGASGRNLYIPRDGAPLELAGSATLKIAAGDRIEISTPGGGGWGSAERN